MLPVFDRTQHLGNVDLALSEIRGLQKKEDQEEAKIRTTVRGLRTAAARMLAVAVQ